MHADSSRWAQRRSVSLERRNCWSARDAPIGRGRHCWNRQTYFHGEKLGLGSPKRTLPVGVPGYRTLAGAWFFTVKSQRVFTVKSKAKLTIAVEARERPHGGLQGFCGPRTEIDNVSACMLFFALRSSKIEDRRSKSEERRATSSCPEFSVSQGIVRRGVNKKAREAGFSL